MLKHAGILPIPKRKFELSKCDVVGGGWLNCEFLFHPFSSIPPNTNTHHTPTPPNISSCSFFRRICSINPHLLKFYSDLFSRHSPAPKEIFFSAHHRLCGSFRSKSSLPHWQYNSEAYWPTDKFTVKHQVPKLGSGGNHNVTEMSIPVYFLSACWFIMGVRVY